MLRSATSSSVVPCSGSLDTSAEIGWPYLGLGVKKVDESLGAFYLHRSGSLVRKRHPRRAGSPLKARLHTLVFVVSMLHLYWSSERHRGPFDLSLPC